MEDLAQWVLLQSIVTKSEVGEMKFRIAMLVLILLGFACLATAQQLIHQTPQRFVVVPPEQVLMTVMSQPECPIQFEQVRFLASVEGGGASASFVVHNNGPKPIREFTIGGPDWTMTWSEKFTKKLLMPGERAFEGKNDVEIVRLTDELRHKLELNGPMKAILVVMVIDVEYADGTTYDARPAYHALRKYSERLSSVRIDVK